MLEPADAYGIAEDNPRIDYRIVEGSGHSPHRDAPETTRELVLGWL
jgi:hypothetical protein